MSIGENIAKRREELGYTQEQLAEMVGYKHKSSINKIEKGVNDVSQSKIVALASALKCSVDYLLDGEGKPDNKDMKAEFIKYLSSISAQEKAELIKLMTDILANQ